jgi:hypothetical protein
MYPHYTRMWKGWSLALPFDIVRLCCPTLRAGRYMISFNRPPRGTPSAAEGDTRITWPS